MKYYVTGQLGVVNVKTHALKKIGAPAMVSAVDAGPDAQLLPRDDDGRAVLYVVQYNSFGTTQEIWDATGKVLAQIDKRPSREGQEPDTAGGGFGRGGRGGGRVPRAVVDAAGAGLYYIESEAPARGAAPITSAAPAGGRAGRGGRGGGGASRTR